MAKKISTRSFASEINASVPLQTVTEENNLGYKPLIHDEDENPVSHHRKRLEKLGLFVGPVKEDRPILFGWANGGSLCNLNPSTV